jgi:alpha-beta hydrolase superfamily lysophospholipase
VTGRPFFAVTEPAGVPKALALVLHGGRAQSRAGVRPHQLAVVRMTPFAVSLRRAGRRHGLAVARMRYLLRGWNGATQAPVADVRWVLDRLADRYPDVPVALVGHSMGGRAAIYAAEHPSVRVVVALAPWIEADDPTEHVAGAHVLVAHGDRDRITSASASRAWTRRAASTAASAGFVSIRGDGHAMLRRAPLWHGLATAFVLATLRDGPPEPAVGGEPAAVVSKVLAGQTSFVV